MTKVTIKLVNRKTTLSRSVVKKTMRELLAKEGKPKSVAVRAKKVAA